MATYRHWQRNLNVRGPVGGIDSKSSRPRRQLSGYANQLKPCATRSMNWKKDSGSHTNALPSIPPGPFGMAGPEKESKIGSIFPCCRPTKSRKYFHFTVYAGAATVDGLTLKLFRAGARQG